MRDCSLYSIASCPAAIPWSVRSCLHGFIGKADVCLRLFRRCNVVWANWWVRPYWTLFVCSRRVVVACARHMKCLMAIECEGQKKSDTEWCRDRAPRETKLLTWDSNLLSWHELIVQLPVQSPLSLRQKLKGFLAARFPSAIPIVLYNFLESLSNRLVSALTCTCTLLCFQWLVLEMYFLHQDLYWVGWLSERVTPQNGSVWIKIYWLDNLGLIVMLGEKKSGQKFCLVPQVAFSLLL